MARCLRQIFYSLFAFFFIILVLSAAAFGEGTRTWEQSKFDDLVKGTPNGVAVRSLGGLELAPAFKQISSSPSTYIWDIAADQNGNLFVATGSPARVYRVTPSGDSEVIFEPQELQVQSVVVDNSGTVYAATNPDGKVYRIEHHPAEPAKPNTSESKWSSSVFFEPGTKYIWDLAFDRSENLFVATGDQGKIFKVTPHRDHALFFKSDEVHIRKLAFDADGNLIAGSDGSGLVYRISPAGEGFVLYSAPKKEITALAIDKAGNIYAAGTGEKRGGAATPPVIITPSAPAVAASGSGSQPTLTIGGSVSPSPMPTPASIPSPGAGATGGSEVYRIARDGSPTRIWTSHEDLVYALAFDTRGRLIAGTGNRGHIFAINNEDDYTDLLKASASQITAFAPAPGGGLYVSSSNLGKIFLLGASPQSEGSYESDVFDAHIFSRWGRAEFRGSGMVDLFARSGNVDNPDRNWSPWTKIDMQKGAEISVPPARFIQWKAVLHAGEAAPRIDSVLVNYLPKNVAPDFDEVNVQVGVKYQSLPHTDTSLPGQPHFDAPPPTLRDRESIGVKWTVHDDNDDQMVYSVYYRGDGNSRWLLLKDQLTDKFYSFDASLLPDGGYTVKVVASDAPSHSPGQALSAEKESARFEVDTTPPLIQGLAASMAGDKVHVTFSASDGFSSIKRAEYSVDAGDWQYVEPVGQLSDSKTESYDFQAQDAPASPVVSKNNAGQTEHVVVVRVYDRYDNMSSAKYVIKSKQ